MAAEALDAGREECAGEVARVAVLDADKEGFLRSATSLIQTCGRAARNVEGRVIFYADKETNSIKVTVDEVHRRRALQEVYNAEHGITPETIVKPIREGIEAIYEMDYPEIAGAEALSGEEDEALSWTPKELRGELARLRADMLRAAEELAFEEAASLRDRIKVLERMELRK